MRGDEPHVTVIFEAEPGVFPTCVGMNRLITLEKQHYSRVPHMRGDEPLVGSVSASAVLCSPHAWG